MQVIAGGVDAGVNRLQEIGLAPFGDAGGVGSQVGGIGREATPNESVIDLKGEIVFRRRAFYYVLERLTKKAISKGRLQDTIAADVLRTHTMVSIPDRPGIPRDGRAFLLRNFVRVGCVRVAGMMVTGGQFRIEIPGQYVLLSDRGDFQGTLDGSAYDGPRFLAAGMHTIDSSQRTAVIWQRAAALGFSPFVTDRRCE
jgi:hypothetical protein